jgi:hypothetical protein
MKDIIIMKKKKKGGEVPKNKVMAIREDQTSLKGNMKGNCLAAEIKKSLRAISIESSARRAMGIPLPQRQDISEEKNLKFPPE